MERKKELVKRRAKLQQKINNNKADHKGIMDILSDNLMILNTELYNELIKVEKKFYAKEIKLRRKMKKQFEKGSIRGTTGDMCGSHKCCRCEYYLHIEEHSGCCDWKRNRKENGGYFAGYKKGREMVIMGRRGYGDDK